MAPSSSSAKRSNPHAAPTSPFKRLKAKVGKRAPQAANYTDTTFRATSIHLGSQEASFHTHKDDENGSSHVLTSSRGKSLTELLNQMHHPAVAVRLSAMKGIQDIIISAAPKRPGGIKSSILAANLPPLLSALGKAAVDEEDDDIRKMGLDSFISLMDTMSTTLSSETIMRPFLPLILAFFKSALNSLDRDTRKDGLAFVHALARYIPLSVDVVASMVPAICRIWEDKAFQSTNASESSNKDKKKNKKKRNAPSQAPPQPHQTNPANSIIATVSSGRYPLLDCLLTLMMATDETMALAKAEHQSYGWTEPDLVYIPGGRSKNALALIPTPASRSSPHPLLDIQTIQDLPSFGRLATHDDTLTNRLTNTGTHSSTTNTDPPSLTIDSAMKLISKIRDTLIELQQKECLETFFLLSKVMDRFWDVFGDLLSSQIERITTSDESGQEQRQLTEFHSICNQVRTLLLEAFPLKPSGIFGSTSAKVDAVNGQLCLTLVHMTYTTELLAAKSGNDKQAPKQRASNWLRPVVEYICDRLYNDKSLKRPGNEASQEIILQVLMNLLNSRHDIVQKIPKLEKRLVLAFRAHLVPPEHKQISRQAARSTTGVLTVQLITSLLDRTGNDLKCAQEVYGKEVISDFLSVLPDFLVAWEGDYLDSSASWFQLTSMLFRQRESDATSPNQDEDGVITVIRQKLEAVLDPDGVDLGNGNKAAILETYPSPLQRQFIALLVTLAAPTPQTLSALAHLCALSNLGIQSSRPVLSFDVASFCIQSIFCIRKTLAIQQFLSFLVDSTGATFSTIPEKNKDIASISSSRVIRFDNGLREVNTSLICCGASKIATMLGPLLLNLLDSAKPRYVSGFFQTRFVWSLLAMLALEVRRLDPQGSILPILPPSSTNALSERLFGVFQTLGATRCSRDLFRLFMAPIKALLLTEPSLTTRLFHVAMGEMSALDEEGQVNASHCLLFVANDQSLRVFSRTVLQDLILVTKKAASSSQASVSKVLEQVGIELEVACGGGQS